MVNQGYRKTDIGIIPDEWSVIKVKDIVTAPLSYGVNAAAVEYDSNLPQYIRITDITDDGRYDSSNKVSIDIESLDKYTLSVGDILFARTGASTGKTYLYTKTDGKLIYAGFLIRASIDTDKYDPYYVFLQFHTPRYYDWVSVMSTRSGQPGINGKEYGSYQLPMPSLDEQKAIATALSDIDALIVNLEKLIAKKKAIKQGALQELLTGKRRLPGFDGEWTTTSLKNVLTIFNGYAFKSSTYDNNTGIYKVITIANVQNGYLIASNCNMLLSLPSDIQQYQILKIGDLLISMTGNVGRVCFVTESHTVLNQRVGKLVVSDKHYAKFVFNALNTPWFLKAMITAAKGGAQPNLGVKDIYEYELHCPSSIEEEKAISNIIDDMQVEIDALEQKISKLINIRGGMMRELLTGRIRLIDKEDA